MDFYYQIKGKGNDGFSNWAWPPIFTGKITAENKKNAKNLIEVEYGRKFPLKVLAKDLESNMFLLSIQEIKEDDDYTKKLFETQTCKHCGNSFKIIDKYNDDNCRSKSHDYCCDDCKEESSSLNRLRYSSDQNLCGSHVPVIYKITHKPSGKCYIGKTTQAFTLRWYQHFFQSGNCKFHDAVKSSSLTEWTFEVVEIVKLPEAIKTTKDAVDFIRQRENYHITLNDSCESGFNSRSEIALPEEPELLLFENVEEEYLRSEV